MAFTIANPPEPSYNNATVVLGQQHDALVSSSGNLTSFDLDSRTIQWKLPGNYSGAMAIDDGIVFAAKGIELELLDEATGAKLNSWFAPPAVALSGNLLVTDNMNFTGTTQGTYAIDRVTLNMVWSTPLLGDLALGNNVLLISTTSGLYAYAVPEPSGAALVASASIACFAGCAIRSRRRNLNLRRVAAELT